jgi:hypothetical protein
MKKAKTRFWNPPAKSECRKLTGKEKQTAQKELLERAAANDDDYGSGLE